MIIYPKVSIIIPTYKNNGSLIFAIESVRNQEYENSEIIVVDDNEPNTLHRRKTEKMMERYALMHNVCYIKHEKNLNGSAARNTGFRSATGKYICLLDDDDIFLPMKIHLQVEFLEKNECFQAVYCWRYQHGILVTSDREGDLTEDLLSLTFTPFTSSLMLRYESYKNINGFNESYKRHQDYEFMLRFFEKYRIGVVGKPLIEIKGNEVNNSLIGKELENLKKQFLLEFDNQIVLIDKKKRGFKNRVYAKHFSTVFWSYCRQGQYLEAFGILFQYSRECGFIFLKYIFDYFIEYLKVRRLMDEKKQ